MTRAGRWLFPAAFLAVLAVNWVRVASFTPFAFHDLGGFLHLDALLAEGAGTPQDLGYIYGPAPLVLQRVLFAIFGRGHGPILGLTAIYLFLHGLFWARVFELSGSKAWSIVVILCWIPLLAWMNPSPAHVMMQLSVLFGLLSVWEGKLERALAICAAGALAIPSMPLALGGMIVLTMAAEAHRDGSWRGLIRRLAPAAAVYGSLAAISAAFLGIRETVTMFLPLKGAGLYKALNFGFFRDGRNFWDPDGARITYYLGTKAGFWIVATIVLLGACGWIVASTRGQFERLDGRRRFVLLAGGVHLVFIFVAFGNAFCTMYYEPVLAAGVFAALVPMATQAWARCGVLVVLSALAVSSQIRSFARIVPSWSANRISPQTGLYTSPGLDRAWTELLARTRGRTALLLTYGSGVSHYYPEIATPRGMFLLPTLLSAAQHDALLQQIESADSVIVYKQEPIDFIRGDAGIQTRLSERPRVWDTPYFTVYER